MTQEVLCRIIASIYRLDISVLQVSVFRCSNTNHSFLFYQIHLKFASRIIVIPVTLRDLLINYSLGTEQSRVFSVGTWSPIGHVVSIINAAKIPDHKTS